jgi:hypothetical protein
VVHPGIGQGKNTTTAFNEGIVDTCAFQHPSVPSGQTYVATPQDLNWSTTPYAASHKAINQFLGTQIETDDYLFNVRCVQP